MKRLECPCSSLFSTIRVNISLSPQMYFARFLLLSIIFSTLVALVWSREGQVKTDSSSLSSDSVTVVRPVKQQLKKRQTGSDCCVTCGGRACEFDATCCEVRGGECYFCLNGKHCCGIDGRYDAATCCEEASHCVRNEVCPSFYLQMFLML